MGFNWNKANKKAQIRKSGYTELPTPSKPKPQYKKLNKNVCKSFKSNSTSNKPSRVILRKASKV